MVLPDRYALLFLLFPALLISSATAQDIPTFSLDQQKSSEFITDSILILRTEQNLTPEQAWDNLMESGQTGFSEFGFTDQRYWLGMRFQNLSDADNWLLEIENPHIDFITLYIRSPEKDEWITVEQIGDTVPYHNRTVSHYYPALPIDFSGAQELDLMVMLYKQHSAINFNLRLWEQTDFGRQQQIQYTMYGSYFGILLLVVIAAGITFFFTRRKTYLWYLLYILTVGFYILADTGLAHQFIYPGSDTIPNYTRMILTYGFLFTFIPFTQHYFSTSLSLPKYHRIFNILMGITFLHFVIFTAWFLLGNVDGILALSSKSVIILICQLFLLFHGIIQLSVKRTPALFYLAAFSAMLLGGIYKIFTQFGVVPRITYPLTPLQIAFFAEIVILTVGLGWQIRTIDLQKARFRNRINKLKSEKLRAYIEGTEKERTRIAMDLHDAVGSRLSHLIRLIETDSTKNESRILTLTKKIFSNVRNISHQLAPPGLQLTNLEQNIKKLVHDFNENSPITYRLQILDIPKNLPEELATNIYRLLQEGINNIEKHSQADHADIQLIAHDDQLVLTIEDDGIGLPAEESTNGIGLENLRRRSKQLGGSIEISSIPNKGVHILILLPIANSTHSSAETEKEHTE